MALEKILTDEDRKRVLDCGHHPSAHSSCTNGIAYNGKRTMCYDCAEREEKIFIGSHDKYCAYLSGDGASVTMWPGNIVGKVTAEWGVYNNFARGKIARLRVAMFDGSQWYGTSPGRGMYCRLHRVKGSTASAPAA